MTEDQLAAEVARLCAELGARSYHSHTSRRSVPGWPDLVLWGPGGIIFRELKSTNGRASREQLDVMRSLREAGANVALWRPYDLEAGLIEHELRLVVMRRAPPPSFVREYRRLTGFKVEGLA